MTSQDSEQTANIKKTNRGEMIAVCSAKGGVGRTTLTVNLATAFYKNNFSVGVVDGDFQFGDVALALDLQSTFTIKEVIESIDNLDEQNLLTYLSSHERGVKVLPAPERPEFADLITKENVNTILDQLINLFDYVFVDTGVGFNEHTLNFVEKADKVFIVTNLEMATLKNTKLMLETFELLGIRDKVHVIINRATMDSVISATDAAQILKEDKPFYIPNDFQVCSQALNIGIPFVLKRGKTEVAKSIYKMAETFTAERDSKGQPSRKKTSLISKLFPQKKKKGGNS